MNEAQIQRDKESFLREISKEMLEENVAVFAGAGLSASSGIVSWSELLRPIAEDIGLDVDKEHDLVSLAQFHCNVNGQNRGQLNRRLIEEFSKNVSGSENHKILSRLPINTYWTTNYDKLIEKSLEEAGKVVDVKYTIKQLANTKPKRDCIVYKMHGDVDHPNDAVLTKDDYEAYHVKMDHFISTLSGDLLTKTFIFVGFSFTDPNLDYILSRVRIAFDGSQRPHYCFLRKVKKEAKDSDADYSYKIRKQELFIGDLVRFQIKPLLVDEFEEITSILQKVEDDYRRKTIFISGAAHDYGKWSSNEGQQFVHSLSKLLIQNNYKIVSGFGLGIGSAVISGALEEIYSNTKMYSKESLVLRPFPQSVFGKSDIQKTWNLYRRDMLTYAGISIFLFGNKVDKSGNIVNSDGMNREYEIAKEYNHLVIPIGATGYIAREIWELEIPVLRETYKGLPNAVELLEKIGSEATDLNELAGYIVKLLKIL